MRREADDRVAGRHACAAGDAREERGLLDHLDALGQADEHVVAEQRLGRVGDLGVADLAGVRTLGGGFSPPPSPPSPAPASPPPLASPPLPPSPPLAAASEPPVSPGGVVPSGVFLPQPAERPSTRRGTARKGTARVRSSITCRILLERPGTVSQLRPARLSTAGPRDPLQRPTRGLDLPGQLSTLRPGPPPASRRAGALSPTVQRASHEHYTCPFRHVSQASQSRHRHGPVMTPSISSPAALARSVRTSGSVPAPSP
jgi:hypothetical protein